MKNKKKCTLEFLQIDFLSESEKYHIECLEGFGLDKKDEIYSFVREKVENHIPFISASLNEALNVQKSNRFWRIALGHWFSVLTQLCYFRYQILSRLLKSDVVTSNPQLLFNKYLPYLNISSTGQFLDAYVSKAWNRSMSHYAAELLDPDFCAKDNLEKPFIGGETCLFKTRSIDNPIMSRDLKSLKTAGKRFICSSRVVIYKSYLERKVNILLQLRLGIKPKSIKVPLPNDLEVDVPLRNSFHKKWLSFCRDDFDRFLIACAVMTFPRSLLEAFSSNCSELQSTICQAGDVVFTSNGFDADDMFQLFSALSVENGARFIAGQHGNNYCSSRHFYSQDELSKTANYFLTWGTRGISDNSFSTFNFKYPSNKISSNPSGPILLLLHRPPSPIFMWDRYKEFEIYLDSIRQILQKLTKTTGLKTIVRFHKNYSYFGGDIVSLARDFPQYTWDDGNQSLTKIMESCSLVIHTYHSTGILETLNQGFPTLVFWPCGWELSDEAQKDYAELKKVRIFHHSVNSLLREIKLIETGTKIWWKDCQRNKVVEGFCGKYSRQSKQPIKKLLEVLKKR